MGNETRHMHLFVFCRSHPGEQELAPLEGGVYNHISEVEAVLDSLVETGAKVYNDRGEVDDGIDFRAPGILGIHTTGADGDPKSIAFGGDGRCHRVFTQVWCIGDPDECADMIAQAATMKMIASLPGMLTSDDPMVQGLATAGLAQLLAGLTGGELPPPTIMSEPPRSSDFGSGYANEPFDDFLDFGGFDEPTDKKRLH